MAGSVASNVVIIDIPTKFGKVMSVDLKVDWGCLNTDVEGIFVSEAD
jgi:hypothetical protein